MTDWIDRWILTWMRVPPEPHAPAGSPESVRIFRAGRNYYRWRIANWALVNAGALAALVAASIVFDHPIGRLPPWAQWGLRALELLGFAGFAASLPFTFLQQRLNYRLRWYILTDRSLRIRSGIWSVQELTTTFANVQEIRVASGPLQKALGLADVEVHSAGGGKAGPDGRASGHIARFEGVDNANEIRDSMVERLRRYRDSGLGEAASAPQLEPGGEAALVAARAVLAEARALHAAVGKR